METKIIQYYDNYYWSCTCGAGSGASMGYADEEGAQRAARLHMELMHPSEVITEQAERIQNLEFYIASLADVITRVLPDPRAMQISAQNFSDNEIISSTGTRADWNKIIEMVQS